MRRLAVRQPGNLTIHPTIFAHHSPSPQSVLPPFSPANHNNTITQTNALPSPGHSELNPPHYLLLLLLPVIPTLPKFSTNLLIYSILLFLFPALVFLTARRARAALVPPPPLPALLSLCAGGPLEFGRGRAHEVDAHLRGGRQVGGVELDAAGCAGAGVGVFVAFFCGRFAGSFAAAARFAGGLGAAGLGVVAGGCGAGAGAAAGCVQPGSALVPGSVAATAVVPRCLGAAAAGFGAFGLGRVGGGGIAGGLASARFVSLGCHWRFASDGAWDGKRGNRPGRKGCSRARGQGGHEA